MKNIQNVRTQQMRRFTFQFLLLICMAVLLSGCNESHKTAEYGTVSNTGAESLKSKAVRIVIEGLTDDDPRIRATAIEVVATTKQLDFMLQIQQLLGDQIVPVRFLAAVAVGDLEYSPAKSKVQQLLKVPDKNTQMAAAYALARLGDSEKLDVIRDAVTSKDQKVRANAVWLLGKSGDEKTIPLLKWAQSDVDSADSVKLQALEARAKLGDQKVLKRLWAIVFSTYADDRITGITAMGALGTPKAQDILITKLDDDVLEVRLAAAEQLGLLGNSIGEAEVLDVFAKKFTAELNKTDIERINARTALAIGQIGTPAVMKFLPGLLENKSKLVRLAAAKAVFQRIADK